MADFSGKRILLVEDDVLLNKLMSKKLIENKADVTVAVDGQEAVDKIKENPKFDLVLLDIMLPKMDGFQVLENIRADKDKKDTVVVILSNLGQKNDVERGVSLGAKKFLVKAILSPDEIIEEVDAILNIKN
jgi:CheY-like chemotaxis protein